MTGPGPKKNLLFWVDVIAMCLLVTSLIHAFRLFVGKDEYLGIIYKDYLPGFWVYVRYLFSWFQRVVGLSCAIGLFLRKDFFRRLTIYLGIFSVLTIYWKHPYGPVKNSAVDLQALLPQDLQMSDPQLMSLVAAVSVVILIVWDIVFWAIVIKHLTRKDIKEAFLKKG